jgi:hypothetical protein
MSCTLVPQSWRSSRTSTCDARLRFSRIDEEPTGRCFEPADGWRRGHGSTPRRVGVAEKRALVAAIEDFAAADCGGSRWEHSMVDAHVHVWTLDPDRFPSQQTLARVPILERAAHAEDLITEWTRPVSRSQSSCREPIRQQEAT